ncbi:hypothetical protein CYK37_26515 [Mesorhizobium loti]|nr:hypothetical protein CYK37_26515 [Mesorhizobium loti]
MELCADAPLRLHLYVAGDTPAMQAALDCREVLLRRLGARIEIAVVDILADPQAARSAGILAVPALSDDTQAPPRRLVGHLGVPDQVLEHFDLQDGGTRS